MSEYHTPVLLNESISALIDNPSGTYVDATFGGGGHTAEILSRLSSSGRVIAFDRDSDALENKIDDDRLTLIHNNFRFIQNYLLVEGRRKSQDGPEGDGQSPAEAAEDWKADGILADLGVSSHQFDTAGRGFSFRYDAPLDMRMDKGRGKTAADIVNTYSERDLETVLRLYGEVDNSRRVTRLLTEARTAKAILTTGDLYEAISGALPKTAEHKYLAKVYQALRIEVNQEMRSLEKFLEGATESLRPGGKLVIITYQSLEDRMVKNFIRTGNIEGVVKKDFYGNLIAPLEAINRKPILPQESEISANTRARSAKLRIAAKTIQA